MSDGMSAHQWIDFQSDQTTIEQERNAALIRNIEIVLDRAGVPYESDWSVVDRVRYVSDKYRALLGGGE